MRDSLHELWNENATPEDHQLIDDPESDATIILEINKSESISIEKSTTNAHRYSSRAPAKLKSCNAYEILLENDVDKKQNKIFLKQIFHKNAAHKSNANR